MTTHCKIVFYKDKNLIINPLQKQRLFTNTELTKNVP